MVDDVVSRSLLKSLIVLLGALRSFLLFLSCFYPISIASLLFTRCPGLKRRPLGDGLSLKKRKLAPSGQLVGEGVPSILKILSERERLAARGFFCFFLLVFEDLFC